MNYDESIKLWLKMMFVLQKNRNIKIKKIKKAQDA